VGLVLLSVLRVKRVHILTVHHTVHIHTWKCCVRSGAPSVHRRVAGA